MYRTYCRFKLPERASFAAFDARIFSPSEGGDVDDVEDVDSIEDTDGSENTDEGRRGEGDANKAGASELSTPFHFMEL
jgi:hypothetical protein